MTGSQNTAVRNNHDDNSEIIVGYGTEIKRTFRLFWPIFLGQFATNSMGVVDTVMAGLAGTTELSGVAIGSSFYWPAVLFVVGFTFAIQPTVAQLRGRGRPDLIAEKMHLATVLGLIIAVLTGIVVVLLPLIYKLIPNIDPEMVRIGHGYLIAIGLGMPAFTFFSTLRGYWEGLGNTLPTLIFGFAALFLNIPLNYIFIFGIEGMVPAYGGIGCGIATTLTMYINCVLALIYVKKHPFFARFRLYEKSYPINRAEAVKYVKFGMPLALSATVEVACFSLVSLMLSPFGPVVVSSHAIAMNVSGMIFMVPLSLAMASTVRVGESMGARQWNAALHTVKTVFGMALFFYVIAVSILFFLNEFIISLYTEDPEVMGLAALLLLYCAVYQLPDHLQAVGIGVLRGFKDSRTIFIITIIAYWMIGVPAGYLLGYGYICDEPMGAPGFWIGFILSLSAATLMYLVRIYRLFTTRTLPKAMSEEHM